MTHYLELCLRLDPEFPAPMLMGALYSKLHRGLAELEADDIGVSLPTHQTGVRARKPGDILRLHGTAERLEQLMATDWLKGMHDHVQVADVSRVPADAEYRTVRRYSVQNQRRPPASSSDASTRRIRSRSDRGNSR